MSCQNEALISALQNLKNTSLQIMYLLYILAHFVRLWILYRVAQSVSCYSYHHALSMIRLLANWFIHTCTYIEIYYWFLYILIAASILIKIGALSQILILSAHCTSNKFSLNIAKIYFYFSRCDNYKLPWRMSVVYCLYELGIISCSTITVWENTCIMIKKVYLVLINKPIFLYS